MICYAMNRPNIRFYAVDGSDGALKTPDPFIPLTEELDIKNFKDRFQIIQTTINIARILVTIKNGLPTIAYPLGKKKKLGATEITFHNEFVEKSLPIADLPYHAPGRIEFLQAMYSHAQGHRGLVQISESGGPKLNTKRTYYRVFLKTRGVRPLPQDERELRGMVKDLVTGLEWLHSENYLHRDIRFPNVVYDRAKKEYVLIDFEHGGRSPTRKSRKHVVDDSTWLKGWESGTLDGKIYNRSSEMYQLAKLLDDEFKGQICSEDGKDFIARLKGKSMTAKESLQHRWICDIP